MAVLPGPRTGRRDPGERRAILPRRDRPTAGPASAQWLIIHGRADGNRLLPSAPFTVRLGKAPAFPGLQHEQLMPCPPLVERGAWALRSFTSCDLRSAPDI